MNMNLRPEAQELLERVSNFLESEVAPNEAKFHEQIKTDENRWNYFPEIVEELKDKAKSQGLWNLFLPESEFGAGLTNYEYAHLASKWENIVWDQRFLIAQLLILETWK